MAVKNKTVLYKAVIFDLGGVYFRSGLLAFADLSRREGFKENRFLKIIKAKYLEKIETGKMTESDFWIKFKHDVGFKMPIAIAKNAFLSAHKPMEGMKELGKKLRKKYKLGLLTNNVAEWYKRIDEHFKIANDFDAVVVSAIVKVRKPRKRIYKIMADSLGVKVSECIFFDDFPENVLGAQKAGMKAYKFKSAKDAEKKLSELGIINMQKTRKAKISSTKMINGNIVNFKINGKDAKCEVGTSILKALGENNIYVPTLCYAPIFPPSSSCRVCLVEVKGSRNLLTACSNEVKEGMEIFTDTKRVEEVRQTNLKLLYQDHIGKCPTCVRLKNCELLRMVSKYKAGAPDFKGVERKIPIDKSGVVIFDMSKCIKCGRCIEACKKFGSDVLEMKKRGFNMVAGTKNGKNLKNSGCISCKQCASVCPVGAIYEKK